MAMNPKLLRPRASGFNPKSIANLFAWFDADDSSTYTVSTGVSSWRDKSGNGLNAVQGTASVQPTVSTIGSRRAFLFFAGSGLIASKSYSISAQSTFCVFRCDTTTAFGRIITQESDAANATYVPLLLPSPAAYAIGSYFSGGFRSSTNITQSATIIGESHHNGSSVTAVANGTSGSAYSAALSFSPTKLCIGNGGNLSNSLIGAIAEVLVWNRALSASEITQVRKYLAKKYSVTV